MVRGNLVGKKLGLFLKSSSKIMICTLKAVLADEVLVEVDEEVADGKERKQEIAVYKDDVAWWKPLTMRKIELVNLYIIRCISDECKGRIVFTNDTDKDKDICKCVKHDAEKCKIWASSFSDMPADTQAKVLSGQVVDLREKSGVKHKRSGKIKTKTKGIGTTES